MTGIRLPVGAHIYPVPPREREEGPEADGSDLLTPAMNVSSSRGLSAEE